jgi:hypothetical protein
VGLTAQYLDRLMGLLKVQWLERQLGLPSALSSLVLLSSVLLSSVLLSSVLLSSVLPSLV